jgi:hypothetical protein
MERGDEPQYSMTKTSQRAGVVTSVLVVVFFVTAVGFRISGGDVPNWFPITMGAILCATTISAVICLVSASFAFFRGRRRSNAANALAERAHRKFNLEE